MSNNRNFFLDTQHFVYKNISFLVTPHLCAQYVCNVCDVEKQSRIEKAVIILPYKDITYLGFRNGTFCTTCAEAFMANPDKFIFEHSLGLLTKK